MTEAELELLKTWVTTAFASATTSCGVASTATG